MSQEDGSHPDRTAQREKNRKVKEIYRNIFLKNRQTKAAQEN